MYSAWDQTVITFYLLSRPTILRKLKAELETAFPLDAIPTLKVVESLPYLQAVVSEGLRLGIGVSARQTRISPDEPLHYQGWVLPAGTPVGISAAVVHFDEKIFPNPEDFVPERFLNDPALKKSIIPFSLGSRQCLGMNLAYAELYLSLAVIFRRFGSRDVPGANGNLVLYDTDESDVKFAQDKFVPYPKKGSKGVRVKIEKV